MVSNDDRGNAKSAMFHNFHHFPSAVHQFNLRTDLSDLYSINPRNSVGGGYGWRLCVDDMGGGYGWRIWVEDMGGGYG